MNDTKLIAVITSLNAAAHVAQALSVEAHLHSGLPQLVSGLRDGRPDVVMFANAAGGGLGDWARERRATSAGVRFIVLACAGIDSESALDLAGFFPVGA